MVTRPLDVSMDVDPIDILSVYPSRLTLDERSTIVSRMVHNIRTVERSYVTTPDDVAAGIGWYRVARRLVGAMADRHDTTTRRMAGVVAAASPRVSWYDNLRTADMVHRDRRHLDRLIPAARRPVSDIMSGVRPLDTIRGRKTRSFYRNLLGDMMSVTNDTWMLRIATGRLDIGDREYRYLERSGGYDTVSDAVTMSSRLSPWPVAPAEYQAMLWTPYRRHHGRRDERIDMTDTDAALAAVSRWEDTTT